jgi:hypothetical protein
MVDRRHRHDPPSLAVQEIGRSERRQTSGTLCAPSGPAPREPPRLQQLPYGDDHQPGILRVHDILDGSEQVSQGDGVAR